MVVWGIKKHILEGLAISNTKLPAIGWPCCWLVSWFDMIRSLSHGCWPDPPEDGIPLLQYMTVRASLIQRYLDGEGWEATTIMHQNCQYIFRGEPERAPNTRGTGSNFLMYIPYPRERGPTTECPPTPHFGLNFLLRSSIYSNMRPCVAALENVAQMAGLWGLNFVWSISNVLNSCRTKPIASFIPRFN